MLDEPCPVASPCRCYGTKVDCVYDGLDAVPTFTFTPATHYEFYIDLRKNIIASLPAHAFGNIDVIQTDDLTINCNENRINSIDYNAFDNFGNTSVNLFLSHNNITAVPKALIKVNGLKSLQLLGNGILYLEDNIMATIGHSLKSLWLNMASLAIWPRSMSYLGEVAELDLENIPFHSIPDSGFNGLHKVNRLTITDSKLTAIPEALCNLYNLHYLEFQHNMNIPTSTTTLIPNCATPLRNVTAVLLGDNNLLYFPENVFRVFSGARSLSLSNNYLSNIPTSSIPDACPLYYLYISNNRFTKIPHAVSMFPELLTLIASNNDITSVDDVTLSGLQNLRQLTLIDVPLRYIDPHAFSTSYTLRDLHLENTNLTAVPPAVLHCADRFNVDLTGSPITCTCRNLAFIREYPIADFAGNQKRFRGDCVNTDPLISIQDFIIDMTSHCA